MCHKEIPSLAVMNKKVVSLNQEYTAMLASSLESQRIFYQESLQEMENNASGVMLRKTNEIHALEQDLRNLDDQIEEQFTRLDSAKEEHE